MEKYQDYVIKDGKFIGKFEEMYQKFEDPWGLIKSNEANTNINYTIILHYALIVKNIQKKQKLKTIEIGCGYPQISQLLFENGFDAYGADISSTVINKSKKMFPELNNNLYVNKFEETQLYENLNPDIFIMSDISWYVLNQLNLILDYLKGKQKGKFFIHSLAVYDDNVQKYGREYFYDLETILKYFGLQYINYGFLKGKESNHTFFLAKL